MAQAPAAGARGRQGQGRRQTREVDEEYDLRSSGRKVDDGESVRVVCPDGETSYQGEFHHLDGWFGFNLTAPKMEPEGDANIILQISTWTFETRQLADDAFDQPGQLVYFDEGAHRLTTGGGFGPVGKVRVPKDASGAIWMRLYPQIEPAGGGAR